MGLFGSKTSGTATEAAQKQKKPLFTAEQREEDAKLLNELKIKAESADTELRKVQREATEREEILNGQITTLTAKNEALVELSESANELVKDKIRLEKKEAMLDAKEEGLDSFTEEIKKLKEQQEEVAAAKYKTGYADGLSDGIRKGVEVSAEDRKNASQVAMMAAASHTPAAAEAIAKGMNNALPAGKTS